MELRFFPNYLIVIAQIIGIFNAPNDLFFKTGQSISLVLTAAIFFLNGASWATRKNTALLKEIGK